MKVIEKMEFENTLWNGDEVVQMKCPLCDRPMELWQQFGSGDVSWYCRGCDYEKKEDD
jgi:transposase-like protein